MASRGSKKPIPAFPFGLAIYDSSGVGVIPYDKLRVQITNTSFREDDEVPSDAHVVGHTWRYVNRDGGPDRRFNNNRQLPIAEYGVLSMTSETGLNELFQTSRSSVVGPVAEAIHAMPQVVTNVQRLPLG